MPTSDVFIMVLVTLVTAVLPGNLAVLIGVVVAALCSRGTTRCASVRRRVDEQGWKHYELYGPLFFGSTTVFAKFDVEGDPEHVVLDFRKAAWSTCRPCGAQPLDHATPRREDRPLASSKTAVR